MQFRMKIGIAPFGQIVILRSTILARIVSAVLALILKQRIEKQGTSSMSEQST